MLLCFRIISWPVYLIMMYITQGPGGVTVNKTNQALIIGIYDEPMTPGQCNMVVERIGDYLVEQGLQFRNKGTFSQLLDDLVIADLEEEDMEIQFSDFS